MEIRLAKTVQAILAEVQSITGKPVEYRENEHLPVAANIVFAGEGAPCHVLSYRRGAGEGMNHLIANECGFFLRMFRACEDARRIPVANQQTMVRFMREMKDEIDEIAVALGVEKVRQLLIVWYDGIVFQLTRMPTDIMVEKWLYTEYPEFRPLQLKAILQQRETAVLSLSDRIRKVMPQRIFDTSHLMNYVYFRILGDHFGVNYVNPYLGTRYREEGEGLVKITEENRLDTHEGDVRMVDLWADFLDLRACYEWQSPKGESERRVH
jgi:hypothetical protein